MINQIRDINIDLGALLEELKDKDAAAIIAHLKGINGCENIELAEDNQALTDFVSEKNVNNLKTLLAAVRIETTDMKAEREAAAAEEAIIGAYKDVIEGRHDDKADDFATKLLEGLNVNEEQKKNIEAAAKGVFKALHSQYGNKEINDNLEKVKAQPTIWEHIKNFISKLLIVGLIIGTNVDDKKQYKSSFAEYTQQKAVAAINQGRGGSN